MLSCHPHRPRSRRPRCPTVSSNLALVGTQVGASLIHGCLRRIPSLAGMRCYLLTHPTMNHIHTYSNIKRAYHSTRATGLRGWEHAWPPQVLRGSCAHLRCRRCVDCRLQLVSECSQRGVPCSVYIFIVRNFRRTAAFPIPGSSQGVDRWGSRDRAPARQRARAHCARPRPSSAAVAAPCSGVPSRCRGSGLWASKMCALAARASASFFNSTIIC